MEDSKRQETARAPALPWTVRFQIFGLVVAASVAQRRNGTVNRSFFSLVDRQVRASARPDKFGVRSDDVDVDASRGLWARVFKPSEAQSPLPVVVYFHGGGFALLSSASVPYDDMCRRFCRELGAVVLSVNYRLAPEYRYPAAYDDGVDVLGYLEKNRLQDPAVQVDLSACFVAGDSAGGNIAHHVAQRWTAAKSKSIRLAGTILVQPFFGGEERTESERRLEGVAPIVSMRRSDWSWRAFLPEGADRNHRAAHVTSENADLAEGFPPAMVVIGGFDPEKDWQRQYADLLQQKGKAVQVVEFPEAIHGFFLFPKLPDAGNLVKEIKAFMDKSKASVSSA